MLHKPMFPYFVDQSSCRFEMMMNLEIFIKLNIVAFGFSVKQFSFFNIEAVNDNIIDKEKSLYDAKDHRTPVGFGYKATKIMKQFPKLPPLREEIKLEFKEEESLPFLNNIDETSDGGLQNN